MESIEAPLGVQKLLVPILADQQVGRGHMVGDAINFLQCGARFERPVQIA